MIFSSAQLRALELIAIHGKAERAPDRTSTYVWKVNGRSISGPVDTLIRKGALTLSADRNTATLSDLGRDAYRRSQRRERESRS